MNPCNTPLLLIAWRRTHTLRQVIDAIRLAAPTRLFVACDGPSPERPGEVQRVAAARALLEKQIDWPCRVERLYSDTNQGCRLGVSRAITWFFDQVEEGIILEDDCVPHPDFFPFCERLLAKYKHNSQVWAINGNNFAADRCLYGDQAWAFVSLSQAWGWATWRDRWSKARDGTFLKLDSDIPEINMVKFETASKRWPLSAAARGTKLGHLRNVACGFDTWDYLWQCVVLSYNGLCVSPCVNLVTNVGDGEGGTHIYQSDPRARLTTQGIPLGCWTTQPPLRANRRLNDYYQRQMGLGASHPSFLDRVMNRAYRKVQFIREQLT